jgi:hypothetical protein
MPVVSAPSAAPEPPRQSPASPSPEGLFGALPPSAALPPPPSAALPPPPSAATPPPPSAATPTSAKAPSSSPAAEISSFALNLQDLAGKRVPWAIGYQHLAGAAASAAGLALLLLALLDSTPVRVVLGILAALLLALALGAAVLFALARQGSPPPSPSSAPASAQPLSASIASGLSSLTTRARLAMAGGALAVIAVAVMATTLLASATAEPERAPIRVAATEQTSAPAVAPPKTEIPPEERADYKLKRDGRSPVSGGVLTVSPAFRSDDGAFDLIVHFHGNTELVQESIGAAKLNALILVVNLGTGSGVYEDRYTQPAIFDDALTRVRDTIEKRGLQNAKMRRLALSSWSAGYGAIAKILESKKNLERIDALLMLDGLHAAYMNPKTKTGIDKSRIAPFIRFAKEAAQGQKLFSLTHGDTETHGYASTGQAADAILEEVGAKRSPASGSPPKVLLTSAVGVVPKHAERWLDLTTKAEVGGLRVRGYVGKTPEHHMAHLISMSVTVLPELAERWH